MTKVVCIIPARGGSKGLPRKNLKILNGHPLISWPIEAAKRSKFIDTILVATDDREIADVAKSYGAEVPFLRPQNNATDLTTTEETLQYSLMRVEEIKQCNYELGVFLTCTDIYRRVEWIDLAIENLLADTELESSFAVSRTHKNYWEYLDRSSYPNRMAPWMSNYASRQVRKPIFREDTGLCCVSRTALWREQRRIGDKVQLIEDDRSETAIDIHTELDLVLAEAAFQWMKANNAHSLPPIPEIVI